MPYEKKYEDVVKRLRATLQSVTLRLISLFLLVAGIVGGLVGYVLYEHPPKFLKDDKSGKGTVWKVSMIGAVVGLAAGFAAYYAKWI